jgi:hypothetical protein
MLSIAGGYLSTVLLERRRLRRETRRLAFAFRGEIPALLDQIHDRKYVERLSGVIGAMEETKEPFFMPFSARYDYANVYKSNVNKIGLLDDALPEQIPIFYTLLISVLEDLVSIGGGAYSDLKLEDPMMTYREIQRILIRITELSREIRATIDRQNSDRLV